jgi:hypothetical protein
MIDAKLLADLRRLVNTLKRPEYMADLVGAVPDRMVKDLVDDFRSYNPAPRSPLNSPPATANPVDAAPVRTGTDGPVANTGTGWADSPQIKNWKPPGIDLVDRLVDHQDALDRAQRVRELVEAAGAMAALKPKEPKEGD